MAVQKYRAKISGRAGPRPPWLGLAASPEGTCGAVEAARDRQLHRFRHVPGVYANAHMGPRELGREVRVDAATESVLKAAIVKLGLSARAYHRVLKLARTLADLEGSNDVGPGHVTEAIQYRVLDRGAP